MSRRQSTGKKNNAAVAKLATISVDTSEDSEEVFEVESILDKRFLAGHVSVAFDFDVSVLRAPVCGFCVSD